MEKTATKNLGCSILCTAAGVLAGLHLLCCYVFLDDGMAAPGEATMAAGFIGMAAAFGVLLLILRKKGTPGPVPMGFTLVVSLLGSYYWVMKFPALLREATELLNKGSLAVADYEALRGFGYMGLFLMLALLVMTYVLIAKVTGLGKAKKEGELA